MTEEIATGYVYAQADAAHTHAYLWEPVKRELEELKNAGGGLGCSTSVAATALLPVI